MASGGTTVLPSVLQNDPKTAHRKSPQLIDGVEVLATGFLSLLTLLGAIGVPKADSVNTESTV
jgi:hypothetical protein